MTDCSVTLRQAIIIRGSSDPATIRRAPGRAMQLDTAAYVFDRPLSASRVVSGLSCSSGPDMRMRTIFDLGTRSTRCVPDEWGPREVGMLTKPYTHGFPAVQPQASGRRAWYRRRRTWRLIAEVLYFPIAAIAIYFLVWFLARGELSLFVQAMSDVH